MRFENFPIHLLVIILFLMDSCIISCTISSASTPSNVSIPARSSSSSTSKHLDQIFLPDDEILLPYKDIWAYPSVCVANVSINLAQSSLDFRNCQLQNAKKTGLTFLNLLTDSQQFCCFLKNILDCETKLLLECDQEYATINSAEINQLKRGCVVWTMNRCELNKKIPEWVYIVSGTTSGIIIVGISVYLFFGSYRRVLWANMIRRPLDAEFVTNLLDRPDWRHKYFSGMLKNVYDVQGSLPRTISESSLEMRAMIWDHDRLFPPQKVSPEFYQNTPSVDANSFSPLNVSRDPYEHYYEWFAKNSFRPIEVDRGSGSVEGRIVGRKSAFLLSKLNEN
ncbi:hypothetical protein SSS_06232 [Sarcoptes scabiei]|uniref:Uncharacterized protein n=1 Tax=Sarcoptes scabiei TaxID=52283 RepID=A0A834VEG3_SARSC|nr:hypothetical protein SSS_06232 [Sarcoptes scabiei]